jgi:hypothetical protein
MDSHTRFEKTPACPTNEALLAYQRSQGGALTGRARGVAAHLAECEFCSLLLDLLRSHPVAEPTAHEPPRTCAACSVKSFAIPATPNDVNLISTALAPG